MTGHLRERATVVVIRDGLVLLARDEGTAFFNMPGGGIEQGEPPEEAAVRELQEETGLIVPVEWRACSCGTALATGTTSSE